jgi:hypothetical protein
MKKCIDKLLAESSAGTTTSNISTLNRVILPVIRRVMPTLVADSIIGVQPMSSPFHKNEWPYQIDLVMKFKDLTEIREWCRTNLNSEEYISNAHYFAFNTETAYAWFILRWA